MVQIIKGSEPMGVEHPVFLVFGQPGIGKSTLGYSMTDVLVLDFDRGAHRASNRGDTVAIQTWATMAAILEDHAALEPYQGLCLDTVGRCLDLMTVDILQSSPKLGRDGNLSQQGWGTLKTRFRTFVSQVRAMGKDLLLLAHDKEDKDGDTRIVRPDITGGSYGEVMKNADFVGYLSMIGKQRVLDFSPTDRWVGKNPAQWEPFILPPVHKATAFMGELYAKGRQALGSISEASARVVGEIDLWRVRIDRLQTADELNAQIAPIKALASPSVQAQAAKLLIDRGEGLGIPFDKTTKRFVAPVPASMPSAAEVFA